MANKKLKVEVDVETEKAKQKLRGLEASGGSSSGISNASEAASKNIRNLSEASKTAGVNMKSAAKAFSGMAIGLAGSYAASHIKDPTARSAVDYASSALTGASMGAMVGGPWGALIGGGMGLAKTFLDKSGERSQMSEDFEKSEKIYASTKAKADRFAMLTDVKKSGSYTASLDGLKSDLANYEKSTAAFIERIREELKKSSPDKDLISDLKRNVDFNRAQMDRYKSAIESMTEAQKKASETSFRESMTATDALNKVGVGSASGSSNTSAASGSSDASAAYGSSKTSAASPSASRFAGGSFSFSVPTTKTQSFNFGGITETSMARATKIGNEILEREAREQTALMRSIAEGINNGGATWQ